MKIIITDQPDSMVNEIEYIDSKSFEDKFNRDIQELIDEGQAKFYGRSLNSSNNQVYKIFTIEDKRILIEDPQATEILKTLLDQDGRIRKFEVKKS